MSRERSAWDIDIGPELQQISLNDLTKVDNCRRRVFSPDDDKLMFELLQTGKYSNWFEIARMMTGKTPRQCRDRWINYLSPINRFDPWTQEEDLQVIKYVNEMGTRWGLISKLLNGRSENCVKNRWYSSLKSRCGIKADGSFYLLNKSAHSDSKNEEKKVEDSPPTIIIDEANVTNTKKKTKKTKKPEKVITDQPVEQIQNENLLFDNFFNSQIFQNTDDDLWNFKIESQVKSFNEDPFFGTPQFDDWYNTF